MPTRTPANPTHWTAVTFSDSNATPPRIVSMVFSWATICDPTAPRPPTTKSWDRFRMQAAAPDTRTDTTIMGLCSGSVRSRLSGARPSTTADQPSMSEAEGTDIQARRAQGSNLSLCAPVSIFCCSAALRARSTLLRTASTSPSGEKCTSPYAHTTQLTTTRHVGRSSMMSKGMPSIRTIGMDTIGCVAIRISVRATEHSTNTLFPTPMQMANDIAMGRIVKTNSLFEGTGTGCFVYNCR
mmetsp:Transcript_120579/g.336444  ORF Transcript_120579/g.336444 Transcript_120579/m.336444 type:complete len:240 (-) Transcript_120579:480-1199(-)